MQIFADYGGIPGKEIHEISAEIPVLRFMIIYINMYNVHVHEHEHLDVQIVTCIGT